MAVTTRRVLVTSSHSLLGAAAVRALTEDGREVTVLSRSADHADSWWDPADRRIDIDFVRHHDTIVHVEGSCLPWYRPRSRARSVAHRAAVDGTTILVDALLGSAPKTFVLVTTAAYYGDHGRDPITEDAPAGHLAISRLARRREHAALPLRDQGTRLVRLRVAWLLHPRVHPLRHQLPLARAGLGGSMGRGDQLWSWITVPDAARAIARVVADDALEGAVNVAAPGAVSSAEFADVLAAHVGRVARVRYPAGAVDVAFGRHLSRSMLLPSRRVVPTRLHGIGHQFSHPTLGAALPAVLSGVGGSVPG